VGIGAPSHRHFARPAPVMVLSPFRRPTRRHAEFESFHAFGEAASTVSASASMQYEKRPD
jgi:hypothetical protein